MLLLLKSVYTFTESQYWK